MEKISVLVFGQPLAPDGKESDGIGASRLWEFITKSLTK